MDALDLFDPRLRLLVLTGSGISAESGLATFRGAGGLWGGQRVETVASPAGWRRDPTHVWAFYLERRREAAGVSPNAAHLALAAAEALLGDRFLLATQNVDGLHGQAGSLRLLELHGSYWRARCTRCGTRVEDHRLTEGVTRFECATCATKGARAPMRPDIVWFDELLDPAHDRVIKRFVKSAHADRAQLVFVAIGTSGTVWPAAGYVRLARDYGAQTWLLNLDAAENETVFECVVRGRATETVPALLGR